MKVIVQDEDALPDQTISVSMRRLCKILPRSYNPFAFQNLLLSTAAISLVLSSPPIKLVWHMQSLETMLDNWRIGQHYKAPGRILDLTSRPRQLALPKMRWILFSMQHAGHLMTSAHYSKSFSPRPCHNEPVWQSFPPTFWFALEDELWQEAPWTPLLLADNFSSQPALHMHSVIHAKVIAMHYCYKGCQRILTESQAGISGDYHQSQGSLDQSPNKLF